jgi:SAM-dependent methyltransferase
MICNDPELRYLQHTPTGAEYVNQITAQETDRRTRTAFRNLVLRLAPPGAKLFDFGAGPGIDARFFAERGFTVDAYDVDPRMRDFFTGHCREFIDSGRVVLQSSSYREFLTRRTDGRRADMVISNFAPLNLIEDPRELFAKFDALTGPQSRILASVLNPCYLSDMRSRFWWRAAPHLWREGKVFLPGPQAPYYRRLLRDFRAVSAPYFQLRRVFPCLLPSSKPSEGVDLDRSGRIAWLLFARCRYIFMLFEKAPHS